MITAYADVAAGCRSPSPTYGRATEAQEHDNDGSAANTLPMLATPRLRATTALHEVPDIPDFDLDAVAEPESTTCEPSLAGAATEPQGTSTATTSKGKGMKSPVK